MTATKTVSSASEVRRNASRRECALAAGMSCSRTTAGRY